HEPLLDTLRLRSRETRNEVLALEPKRAPVSVLVYPWGSDVFVDGWPAGRTPFSGELPWGRHTVRVERPGFAAYDTTLTVWKTTNSDGAVIVEVVEGALRREAGWLRVRSGPSGAEVRLDGVAVGQTPLDLLVPPG